MTLSPQRWPLKQKQCTQAAARFAIVAAVMTGGLSADIRPSTYQLPSNSEVIGYLLQSVSSYRHAYTERQIANEPADLMFLDDNQAIERQIVKLSFEFAKADDMLQTSCAMAVSLLNSGAACRNASIRACSRDWESTIVCPKEQTCCGQPMPGVNTNSSTCKISSVRQQKSSMEI